MRITDRVKEVGRALPPPATPQANYIPIIRTGELMWVSGQIPWISGQIQYLGSIPMACPIPKARAAAELCALNVIAQLVEACGDELAVVRQVVRLGVFVNTDPGFTELDSIADAASDIMMLIFGPAGAHARTVAGATLPRGVPVEIEATFAINSQVLTLGCRI